MNGKFSVVCGHIDVLYLFFFFCLFGLDLFWFSFYKCPPLICIANFGGKKKTEKGLAVCWRMMCYRCCRQICERNCRACCWVSTRGIIKNECQPWAVNYHWVTRWKIKGRCNHISQITQQCASSPFDISFSQQVTIFFLVSCSFFLHFSREC